jgi:hypothetical protein
MKGSRTYHAECSRLVFLVYGGVSIGIAFASRLCSRRGHQLAPGTQTAYYVCLGSLSKLGSSQFITNCHYSAFVPSSHCKRAALLAAYLYVTSYCFVTKCIDNVFFHPTIHAPFLFVCLVFDDGGRKDRDDRIVSTWSPWCQLLRGDSRLHQWPSFGMGSETNSCRGFVARVYCGSLFAISVVCATMCVAGTLRFQLLLWKAAVSFGHREAFDHLMRKMFVIPKVWLTSVLQRCVFFNDLAFLTHVIFPYIGWKTLGCNPSLVSCAECVSQVLLCRRSIIWTAKRNTSGTVTLAHQRMGR